jgi:succinate dehydrogenase / fumarate reductase iron-sulfur subunit
MAGSAATTNTKPMNLKLRVWRQPNRQTEGQIVEYNVKDISPDMSFLEMLDVLNEDLLHQGRTR